MKLEIEKISKKYRTYQVFEQVSYTFESGKIYGIFGPNGIGKTTLLDCIAGLKKPDSGTIKIDGQEINQLTDISYLSEIPIFYKWMRIQDIINFYENFYPTFDYHTFEKFLSLTTIQLRRKLITLSKGELEQVFLSLTLAKKAKVYILDEPFLGLDLENQNSYFQKIIQNYDSESIFIVTTHHPEIVQNIFDQIIFLSKCGIIYDKPLEEILEETSLENKFKEVFIND